MKYISSFSTRYYLIKAIYTSDNYITKKNKRNNKSEDFYLVKVELFTLCLMVTNRIWI